MELSNRVQNISTANNRAQTDKGSDTQTDSCGYHSLLDLYL